MSDRYIIRTTGQTGPGVADTTVTDDGGYFTATTVENVLQEIGAALGNMQPLDSDLTAIAALSTTSFGRALLALADAAAGRTALGLGTAATAASSSFEVAGAAAAAQAASQPLDSDLTAIAALSTTSYGRAFLALADAAAGRTALGLGTIATQAASSVAITGGTISGTTVIDGTIWIPAASCQIVAGARTDGYDGGIPGLHIAAAGTTAAAATLYVPAGVTSVTVHALWTLVSGESTGDIRMTVNCSTFTAGVSNLTGLGTLDSGDYFTTTAPAATAWLATTNTDATSRAVTAGQLLGMMFVRDGSNAGDTAGVIRFYGFRITTNP